MFPSAVLPPTVTFEDTFSSTPEATFPGDTRCPARLVPILLRWTFTKLEPDRSTPFDRLPEITLSLIVAAIAVNQFNGRFLQIVEVPNS